MISFTTESAGPVRLEAFDVRGRLVRIVAQGVYPSGNHTLAWDGRNSDGAPAPAGIYLLRLEAAGSTQNIKAALVR